MISLSRSCVRSIHRFLESAYPLEGAGLLYGTRVAGLDTVTRFAAIRNAPGKPPVLTQREDWFEINPLTMLWIDIWARAEGLTMLGSVHSHPDHPARPSPRDLERSWPHVTYMICAVHGERTAGTGAVGEWTCWELNEDTSAFLPVVVRITPASPDPARDAVLFEGREGRPLGAPPVVQ